MLGWLGLRRGGVQRHRDWRGTATVWVVVGLSVAVRDGMLFSPLPKALAAVRLGGGGPDRCTTPHRTAQPPPSPPPSKRKSRRSPMWRSGRARQGRGGRSPPPPRRSQHRSPRTLAPPSSTECMPRTEPSVCCPAQPTPNPGHKIRGLSSAVDNVGYIVVGMTPE